MNRRTVLPIHRTNTISQDKHIRYEIMNGRKHIKRGSKVELVCSGTVGSVQSSLRGLGGAV